MRSNLMYGHGSRTREDVQHFVVVIIAARLGVSGLARYVPKDEWFGVVFRFDHFANLHQRVLSENWFHLSWHNDDARILSSSHDMSIGEQS